MLRNLVLCASFGSSCPHHALLALDGSLTKEQCDDLFEAARRYFAVVHRFPYDTWKGEPHFPAPQNYAWQSVARHIEGQWGSAKKSIYTGWLWWEGDAVPLRMTWLDSIEAAHVAGKQPFTGHLRLNSYMNGVGVWPLAISNFLPDSGALYVKGTGFDIQAASEVRPRMCAVNHLILHHLKEYGGGEGLHFNKASAEQLLAQNTQAVLFHGCTDGSLQTHLSNGVLGSIETPRGERKTASSLSFYHAGSLGDVIYALPTIRALGGGVLHLGPVPTSRQKPRHPIDFEAFNFIAPLLSAQSYITECIYDAVPPKVDYDLNDFRRHYTSPRSERITSLAALHLRAFRLDESAADTAWLSVVPVTPPTPVLINRSERYHNAAFDWRRVLAEYPCTFVGLEHEHALFSCRYDAEQLKHLPVVDALQLAKLIAGSSLFVGNQSLCYAIAEGLKASTIQETSARAPDCVYERSNAVFVRSALPLTLPPINAPLVTISIACYEKSSLTKKCIVSVLANTPHNVRIIVTDNGSLDNTGDVLSSFKDRIVITTNTDNLGYKDPHNLAFAESQSPYFAILNNDIVVRGDWLGPLLGAMQDDARLGAVGASNGACSTLTKDMHGSPGPALEYIEGSCLLVRRSAVLSVGDTLFSDYTRFAYGEDSDLSLRLRERGWRIAALPLPIEHVRCATTRIVPARYNVDLNKAANHAALCQRWKVYLQRKSFDYRILIVRTGAFGDVLFTTPIIDALKVKWPSSNIVVQTQCPSLFVGNANVALATQAAQPRDTFDYVYDLDLAYEARPHMHAVHAFADVCGVTLPRRWGFKLCPSSADKAWAKGQVGGASMVLLHVGPTNWRGKNWPLERFDAVARFVKLHGFRVALVGTESHSTILSHDLDLRGKTTPQQLAALAHYASLFVGLDSFPAHAAEAARCKVVNICGVCNAQLRSMETSLTVCVPPSPDVACSYELHRLEPPVTYAPCDGACIDSITVEAVKRAVASLLGIDYVHNPFTLPGTINKESPLNEDTPRDYDEVRVRRLDNPSLDRVSA